MKNKLTKAVKHDKGKVEAHFNYHIGLYKVYGQSVCEEKLGISIQDIVQDLLNSTVNISTIRMLATGITRAYEDKGYDIPIWAVVSKVCKFGAGKYELFNYQLGMNGFRLLDAMCRHLNYCIISNEELDKESGLHHFGHAIANLLMIIDLYAAGTLDLTHKEFIHEKLL